MTIMFIQYDIISNNKALIGGSMLMAMSVTLQV